MGKFTNDSKLLLQHVGGKENIKAVTHCITRMRFVLSDPSLANIKEIETIPSVKGTFTQSGQFQVIIGNDVTDFYNDFVGVSGIEVISKDALKEASKDNQTVIQKVMSNLAEIFAPIIPALICGGLILGFRNVIDSIYFFENGTKTLVNISQFWAGVDHFLWLIGEAIFHFLPVGIVWSITKKMGTSQILGIVLGITLVSPQLLNAYAVSGTPVDQIPVWDFGFTTIQMIGYQAQVIPAILAGFTLVYLEKFWTKVVPNIVALILVPFLSLIPAVLIAHVILGPIGWTIGSAISNVVYSALTSDFKLIFAAVFGFLYAPLVITGLHHMSNAIDLQLITDFTGTILWPMIALSNIAQGSAVFAMSVLQKNDERAQQVSIPAGISCYLGVTEPAMFGVNLKYGFPFICALIGSSLAALISVGFGVMANSIGVGGIPGILSIKTQFMLPFALAMVVAIVVPFVLTYIVGKRKLAKGELDIQTEKTVVSDIVVDNSFVSPMEGNVIPLSEVDDKVFSSGMMGKGFAVELSDGKVVSPVNGTIVMTFPTKHAYGIKTDDGVEILVHIGMDTVELEGKGFTSHVENDQRINKGDLLCSVDLETIKAAGKSLVSTVVITSDQDVKLLVSGKVNKNQENIVEIGG